jgi:pilus assembly protein FimV
MIPVIYPINNVYNSRGFLYPGVPSLKRLAIYSSLPVLLLLCSGPVLALGLGELRTQPSLGDRLRLEVEILGDAKSKLDAACFRLVQPTSGSDLPWLKKASLSVRKGKPAILEIRSEIPLREPVVQFAVEVGCGNEVIREYTVLASPEMGAALPVSVRPEARQLPVVDTPVRQRAVRPRVPVAAAAEAPPRLAPLKSERRSAERGLPDRLLLSDGMDVGDPSLRLATELFDKREAKDAERDILRLEFRMLMAMSEQATTQLEAAAKLRNMEATLGEMQQRASDFTQRVEKEASAAPGSASAPTPAVTPSPATAITPPVPVAPPVVEKQSDVTEWGLYGALLGVVLGVGGWLGWRRYQDKRVQEDDDEYPIETPEPQVDPKREGEREELGGVDLAVEPGAMGMPMHVDFELTEKDEDHPEPAAFPRPSSALDSMLSISATTVDEHFEANPVMELADIMLSFGRVKGAAQALQEYIDNNPQEALQPWIRLMDVYRMAGMRAEFESVAKNLNQNFNVEVQAWDAEKATPHTSIDLVLDEPVEAANTLPVAPKPESLEDLPRIMAIVVQMWKAGDVVGYLYQLLRDNRGGQRVGFALPVVEEILFLIELKETSHRMEMEPSAS